MNFLRKLRLAILLNVIFFLGLILFNGQGLAAKVYAHVLEHGNAIGAVLHVTPNDQPVTNQLTDFYLDIKDIENEFDPKDCDCRYEILDTEAEAAGSLQSGQLEIKPGQTGEFVGHLSYTFSQKGLYTLAVTGAPKHPEAFDSFEFKYEIRVSKEGVAEQPESKHYDHTLHIIIFGLGFLVTLAVLSQDKYNEKRKIN